MRRLELIAIVVVAMMTVNSAAQAAEDGPSGFSCVFEKGTAWAIKDGTLQPSAPDRLSFDISGIDLDKQSAKLASGGNTVLGTLRIIRALNANHFLEVANEGFLNLTTIYDPEGSGTTYPAVHSRHFGLLGQPIFAQYAGTCTAK